MKTVNETRSPVKSHVQARQPLSEVRSTIRRAKKDQDHPYLQIRRSTAQDDRLSFEARGLLLYLLSKPGNWIVVNADLQREGKIGMHVLKRLLKELEQYGYMTRSRVRLPDGTFIWERVYYETPEENPETPLQPLAENQLMAEVANPKVDLPQVNKPQADEPQVENQPSYREQIEQKTDRTKDTHTRRASAAWPAKPSAKGGGKPVCVCKLPHGSEFCDVVRIAYARNRPGVTNPVGYANTSDARAGLYDEAVREFLAKVERPGEARALRDASTCPDCHGNGFWYPGGEDTPEGRAAGAAKCRHPRLDGESARLHHSPPANQTQLRTGA